MRSFGEQVDPANQHKSVLKNIVRYQGDDCIWATVYDSTRAHLIIPKQLYTGQTPVCDWVTFGIWARAPRNAPLCFECVRLSNDDWRYYHQVGRDRFRAIDNRSYITADGVDWLNPLLRGRGCYCKKRTAPDEDQVNTAKKFMLACCAPTISVREKYGSSYSWKHRAESWGGENGLSSYVSNGAFLQAASDLGVKIHVPRTGGINAYLALRLL